MDPKVTEIEPVFVASCSGTGKSKKAVEIPEVIDVEQYEFHKFAFDKKKGKAIEVDYSDKFTSNNVKIHLGSPETFVDCDESSDHNSTEVFEIDDYTMFQDASDSKNFPSDVEFLIPWNSETVESSKSSKSVSQVTKDLPGNCQVIYPSATFDHNSFAGLQSQTPEMAMAAADPSTNYDCNASGSSDPVMAETALSQSQLKKNKEDYLQAFKRFDIFEDCPDHHFVSKGNASKQHSNKWMKRIQEDWKMLEKDLPDTIYVRACESRMDLLRAVIIGAEGTPYHDGLFFFDIFFPDTYPSVPPKVYYHSGGLRINPNLYTCGTVCLSLLGTWSGDKKEKWIPKESTMLQLLVSIQGLILNEKPYFNEPGYERQMGTASGESHSQAYSENTYISTLKTMVYTLRRPPQYFEEFVKSYFFIRALDIVYACKAYKAGAPVASVLRGGVQDLEVSDENGSKKFKKDVGSFMKTVIAELVKIGVNELEEKPKPPPEKKIEQKPNLKRRRSARSASRHV